MDLPEVDFHRDQGNLEGPVGSVHLAHSSSTAVIWCSPYFIVWNWAKNIGCKWKSSGDFGYKPQAVRHLLSVYLMTLAE